MNDSYPDARLNSTASIVLSLWLSLGSFVAVTGNAVVLWLFFKNKSLRTVSNRFLVSLSIADFLVGLVIDPVWIVIRCFIQPPIHTVLDYFILLLWVHTTTATTFNICCVSVDRFIAIRFPFRYQEIVTKKRCYTLIILVWLFSMGLPFSTLTLSLHKLQQNFLIMWFSLTFITFVFPLLIVSISYIYIFKLAKEQFKRILVEENPRNYDENIKVRTMQNFKALKTVGFVLGACIITWMPSLVLMVFDCYYAIVDNRGKIFTSVRVVWPWVETLAFTSSIVNPFIYCFRNEGFYQTFRRYFRWFPCGTTKESLPETGLKPDRQLMVRNDLRCRDIAI
ncbi:histamine H2 receptor-like [Stylophora pistillata]|uniref:histamine H2 receptor-like n=1 Tax=Stylophora pistillata TaxID=50429 RepID=UPI000C03D9E6|nr:histamine H2 receptor-like [Stylophora pistillata]